LPRYQSLQSKIRDVNMNYYLIVDSIVDPMIRLNKLSDLLY